MIFDFLPNAVIILNIGVNFIEMALELEIFMFFLLNAKRGLGEKGIHGTLSVRFSLAFLFMTIGRIFFIMWDYIIESSIVRIFAWIFAFLSLIFIIFVFYRVFDKYTPKLKLYLSTSLLIGIAVFLIYSIFQFLLRVTLIFYLIAAIVTSLLIFPQIYAFAKCFIEIGSEFRKYIVEVTIGLFSLVSGYVIASMHPFISLEYSLIIKLMGHTIFVVGIILIAIGFWGLPSIKALEWKEKIKHLFIIFEGGVNIYDQSFIIEETEKTIQSDLMAGGISGITTLMQELTKSKEKAEVIKQKDVHVIFKYGKYVTAALITIEDLEILHTKLKMLVEEFESLFQYILPDWKGDLDVFSPVKVMVKRVFK
ncbi:MAG: hypothetical protein HWN67_03175 [Candidatus Helarchaeota archaeon]|nr:hypothetical protein [Candidatus Helarchaeota archaeon]